MPFGLVFGERVGDAITQKLLDSSSNKVICRSAVQPTDDLCPKSIYSQI